MKFPVHSTRVATVIGATTALVAAMMFGTPAAQASLSKSARMAGTGTASDRSARVDKTFLVQPDGTTVEALQGTDPLATKAPYFRWMVSPGPDSCRPFEMCLWSGDGYGGTWGLFMGGDLHPCEGFRFESTPMQDHTYSIYNGVEGGTSSIWNRYSNGTYNYYKYGLLPPGYHWDDQFSYIMDAWVFDPYNNCTSLHLHQVSGP